MFIINIISSAATHVLRLIITAGVALDSVIFPHHRCSYSMVSDYKSDTTTQLQIRHNATKIQQRHNAETPQLTQLKSAPFPFINT